MEGRHGRFQADGGCEKLAHFLHGHGYEVSLDYLMSAGHEKDRHFELLRCNLSAGTPSFKILLWEKVFEWLNGRSPRPVLLDSLGDIAQYYGHDAQYMS
jgi:hypothetical protein